MHHQPQLRRRCRSTRYVPDVVKTALSFDRCARQLMTDSIHSLHNHATVQPGLTYEQQVAARRARNQECFAQLGLSSLASSFKNKPQQPVAPRTKRQPVVAQPVRKSVRNSGKPTPSYKEEPLKLPSAVRRRLKKMTASPVVQPAPVQESSAASLRRFLGTIKGTQPMFKAVPVHPDTDRTLGFLDDKG